MKKTIFILFLCLNAIAQTKGELKTKNFDYAPFNAFLNEVPQSNRIVARLSEFKTDAKAIYSFYAIVNVSQDSAVVFDGQTSYKLAPLNYILGESVFDILGRLEKPAPFISIYSETKSDDLYCVYRVCKDCKYLDKNKVQGE